MLQKILKKLFHILPLLIFAFSFTAAFWAADDNKSALLLGLPLWGAVMGGLFLVTGKSKVLGALGFALNLIWWIAVGISV